MEKSKSNILKHILRPIIIIAIILIITATVTGLVFAIYVEKNIDKTIDETLFTPVGMGSSTKIYYYDFSDRENRIGEVKEVSDKELYSAYRCKSVKYDQLPKHLINAFISIEDKRFFAHNGVDWKRTISAGINYFFKFNGSFGGSTITQQLIKNVTNNDDYSFQRKIQEIFWALDLETKMDKKEIISMYLNIINLSQGCFGVGAGAEYYFSKDVSELTLAECACIAAITNSPTYYDPIKNPQNNKMRRDIILREMLNQGYIDEAEYTEAVNTELSFNVALNESSSSVNSWYVDMVIDDVVQDLVSQKGYSLAMANLMIYTGGLKIYTAMDIEVQELLDDYYSKTQNFYSDNGGERPQSSIIVIDPKTGDILGVAGGIGEKKANRVQNFATQTLRPAGSVIKPLSIYAPALERGIINWATVYDDVPQRFVKSGYDELAAWPKNANGVYRGLTNINYAITHSINTVSVKVLEDMGLDASFDFLYDDLNIKSIIESKTLDDGSVITDKDYAALALGQFNYGVTLRETVAAYSIFANEGIYNEYRSYLKVTDYGENIILSKPYSGKAVISEETSAIMTKMLKNVIKEGTAKDMTIDNVIDVAGKTGTTQNNYDKWFIGYSPYYICGAWLGYEYPKSLADYGGKSCNKIWDEVMTLLHKKYASSNDTLSFNEPDHIVEARYCADSGLLATEACQADMRGNRMETGYFFKGTEPSEYCTTHVLVQYDKLTGAVASDYCPRENIELVGLINVIRAFPKQIYITDAEYVWRDIGKSVLPETSSSLPFYSNLLSKDSYSGISDVAIQKNCYCREHFNYFKWKEEKEKNQPE